MADRNTYMDIFYQKVKDTEKNLKEFDENSKVINNELTSIDEMLKSFEAKIK